MGLLSKILNTNDTTHRWKVLKVELHSFLTSELYGGRGQPHTTATLAQGKNPSKHWGAGWVSSRTGLEKSLALARYHNVNQPAHSFVYTKHAIKLIYIEFWKVKTCILVFFSLSRKKVLNLTSKLEYTLNSSKLKYQHICIVM